MTLINCKPCKLTPSNMYRSSQVVSTPELLVPIIIELDVEGFKVQDTFTWNLNERTITPEKFAEYFCEDLGLSSPSTYIPYIAKNIKNQLNEFMRFYVKNDVPIPEDTRTTIKVCVCKLINYSSIYALERCNFETASNGICPLTSPLKRLLPN